MPACSVENCEKPTRSSKATLCKMHYHRQYRHGSVNRVARGPATPSVSHGRRYKMTSAPKHPLANKSGRVYVHRQVLYDHIGGGEHACHWCGTTIRWAPKGTPDALIPDHLNGLGDDNRLENLVPSCMTCNTTRGAQAKARALREAGWWSSHDTIAHLTKHARRPAIDKAA